MALFGEENERVTFGKEIRGQSRYGTSSKPMFKRDSYIKHIVVPGDTLQGLSLKYDVSIEHIKRVNSLWTNDSLFLREFLLIPSQITNRNSEDLSPDFSQNSCPQLPQRPQNHTKGANWSHSYDRSNSEDVKLIVDDDVVASDESVDFNNYFSKIDSKIRVAKEKVSQFEREFGNCSSC